jgi:nitroreductase
MDLFAAIDTRTSASRLTEPVPDAAQLTRILEAAVRAPDHGHFAPWRFLIIENEARERLANAVAAARLIRTPDATQEALEAERQKIRRAPMIILVACATRINHPKIPEVEQLLAVGAAVQNLLLAAHALGFGAVWKTGPAAYDAHVKASLGLAPTDQIVAMVHIGTPLAVNPVRPPQLEGVVKRL